MCMNVASLLKLASRAAITIPIGIRKPFIAHNFTKLQHASNMLISLTPVFQTRRYQISTIVQSRHHHTCVHHFVTHLSTTDHGMTPSTSQGCHPPNAILAVVPVLFQPFTAGPVFRIKGVAAIPISASRSLPPISYSLPPHSSLTLANTMSSVTTEAYVLPGLTPQEVEGEHLCHSIAYTED
jgi:hypothetical protein